uniref:Uncharacterized protein n=1 Tax=Rhizophora mucronata TaxID=61149 RepID=A0A2P2Q508_RHIMU
MGNGNPLGWTHPPPEHSKTVLSNVRKFPTNQNPKRGNSSCTNKSYKKMWHPQIFHLTVCPVDDFNIDWLHMVLV